MTTGQMRIDMQPVAFPRRLFNKQVPCGEEGKTLIVIGDIHGRADLFIYLLQNIKEAISAVSTDDHPHHELIILGDFIDRGPQSRDILQALFRLKDAPHVTTLLGNHEACLLDCADGLMEDVSSWLGFGGDATLASLSIAPPAEDESTGDFARRLTSSIGPDILDWLRSLPLSKVSGDLFFCHAGVRPGVPLSLQSDEDLLWIRKTFTESKRHHGKVIVHGHTVTDTPDIRANRIGIDTGAYASGRLTALVVQGSNFWTVSTAIEAVEQA